MRAYLKRYHEKFKAVAFFATCDVSGTSKVLRDMEAFSGLKAWALLEINDADMKSGTHLKKVRRFVRDCQRDG